MSRIQVMNIDLLKTSHLNGHYDAQFKFNRLDRSENLTSAKKAGAKRQNVAELRAIVPPPPTRPFYATSIFK